MPHNNKIIFIHIPKTAGSSIEEALQLNEMRSPTEIPSPQHLIPSEVKKRVDFWDKAFKFTVVRNPYTRAASEFLWRIKLTQVQNANNEKLFNEFLEFVKGVTDYTPPSYDHFRPQVDFIDVDKIFHFEHLEELEKHFNIKLPKVNASTEKPNNLLSERNKKLIKEIYPNDFNL